MARFLFVVPPFTGHINPTVSVAYELETRGHEAAWVGHPARVRPLLPEGARLFELDERPLLERMDDIREESLRVRGFAAVRFLLEQALLPLARLMRPGVDAAVDDFAPDALVVDQQALAGALVARRRGLPWATSATTSAHFVDALAGFPKVKAWQEDVLRALQEEAGVEPVPDLETSPYCVIAFSSRELVGPACDGLPGHYCFVGPSTRHRVDATPFPWEGLGDGHRVLVSLGTVNAERGGRFYRVVEEAFRDTGMCVVLVAPPDLVGTVPPGFIVRDWVPQLELLGRVDAVVSHGGHNTVCEALANGKPLVLLPIKDDQPIVSQQVVDAGAGIRLRFSRVTAAELRDAVHRVIVDPSFRKAALRIRRSFEAAGGAAAAADALEALL